MRLLGASGGRAGEVKLRAVVARGWSTLRRQGVGRASRRLVRRILSPAVRIDRLIFFATDLTKPLPPMQARVPVEIRPASPGDFEVFASVFRSIGLDSGEIQSRIARGDVALLALAGGVLVHVLWVTFVAPEVSEVDARLMLGPGEACAYEGFTLPEWRGHGIDPAVSVAAREYERAQGCTRHIAWAWASNFPSLRTLFKLSYPTRGIWSLWVLGMRRPVALGIGRRGSPSLERLPRA